MLALCAQRLTEILSVLAWPGVAGAAVGAADERTVAALTVHLIRLVSGFKVSRSLCLFQVFVSFFSKRANFVSSEVAMMGVVKWNIDCRHPPSHPP